MRPAKIPEVLPFQKGQRLKTLRHLVRLFWEMWRTSPYLMLGTIVMRLVVAVQPPLALLFTKFIIDEVVRQTGLGPLGAGWIESGRLNYLGMLLVGEFALVFGRDLLQRGIQVLDALQGELHSNRISVDLMRHAAELDLMHFEEASYQDKLERARRQAASRSTVLSQVFGQVQMVITAVALAIGLLLYAPLLILLMAVAILPAVYGEFRFNRLAYWLSHERSPERRQMEYLRQIGASADSAKEVKLFGLGTYLVGKFKDLADKIYVENRRLTIQRSAWGALLGTLSTIAYYGAFAYVVWRTLNGEFTIGDLVFLSGSFGQLNGYFQQILIGFTQIAGQALYLDDLYSFFDIKPTITDPARPKPFPAPLRRGIVFDNVGFRYPGSERFVIRNFNLTINAGETVALVGENGAGKTTIVKLMTRLYEAEEGSITIDGTDIREFSSDDLRRNIGVIFQDFLRYSFTARDNIGVGRIEAAADLPRITRSAEQSLANEVIDKLPGGYDQQLGKQFIGGQDLSGGEWQKLAIARAYMREASIIILDEPTAALDARAEAEVFARFKSLSEAATALLISHRFSTVRMADRIVVLDEGKVLEAGTHEELMALRGHYAELFELQAAGYR
ncbi:MAG: ABC transporter ATP-binding protein [Devosia sp.]|uniref:ABC transporter ATP-binding protein n=1 Tax=Devosia sp. 66-22 TaxID=1895753 RepID=UPI0009277BD9|nr:ABC transporter ATP-binding protein [Devosia sp. 66-22]MBN9348564.1 ABC transporter ATP-binding protein [Devosia sp.]OJX55026.1 MAG: ABC transporter ATP-binding protein [Devosia sp. 66-22]